MSSPARSNWPWTRREDRVLVRRRYRGDSAKLIARELGRTPSSVNNRFAALKRGLEHAHADILARHREEELALLERLLGELHSLELKPESEEAEDAANGL